MTNEEKIFGESSAVVEGMAKRAGFRRGRMALENKPVNLREIFEGYGIFNK